MKFPCSKGQTKFELKRKEYPCKLFTVLSILAKMNQYISSVNSEQVPYSRQGLLPLHCRLSYNGSPVKNMNKEKTTATRCSYACRLTTIEQIQTIIEIIWHILYCITVVFKWSYNTCKKTQQFSSTDDSLNKRSSCISVSLELSMSTKVMYNTNLSYLTGK